MSTKRELDTKAKSLVKIRPDEAIAIYLKIWNSFPNEFNDWDAVFTLQAMRLSNSSNAKWAYEIVNRHTGEPVRNMFGWLIHEKYVKGRGNNEIIANEKHIIKLIELSPQRNLRNDDKFPCPTTISVFKLCEAYTEPIFNAQKINDLLIKINTNLLSNKPETFNSETHGIIEVPSDFEKYYSLRTKALLSLNEFEECKKCCLRALQEIANYHYNNDLWFKMRIALCDNNLGNHSESERQFQEILTSKEGSSKWFLYQDIALVYYEQGKYDIAWKYTIDAVHYGNEPPYLIGLFLLQARILVKLERVEEGKIFAEIIAAILKEQEWKNKDDYDRLFSYYRINQDNVRSVSELMKDVNKMCIKERYNNKTKLKGTIKSVHRNGKVGLIVAENGITVGFSKNSFIKRMKSIEGLEGTEVEFFEMDSFGGKSSAEQIRILDSSVQVDEGNLAGRVLHGTVSNITDIGIFVKLKGTQDGLLHKKSMPASISQTFTETFKIGQSIKVKIEEVTEKGHRLVLIND